MFTLLSLTALVLGAMGAHIPQQEQRGVYFVLPPSAAQQQQQHITPEQVEEVMNQLRQEDGSDSGVYHIVLPDGRLQRVEYTTAPVAQQSEQSGRQVDFAVAQPASPARLVAPLEEPALRPQPSGPAALVAQSPRPVARASEEIKLGPDSRLFLLAQPTELSDGPAQLNEEAAAKPTKYVASVQYTDVQPITGPVYSYNNQPLTRVVRYAPMY